MKVCVVRKVAVAHCVPPELGLALALPDMSLELNVLLSECFKFNANYRPPFYSTEGDDGPVSQAPLLQFEKLGVAVVLARLRDRGISAGGTTGHAAVVAAVTTGLVEERRRSMRALGAKDGAHAHASCVTLEAYSFNSHDERHTI